MIYKAKSNFQCDELGTMLVKGNRLSDENPNIKAVILKYPALFELENKRVPVKNPEVKETRPMTKEEKRIKARDKARAKRAADKKKTIVTADFDAEANPGVIPEYGPTDGEPVRVAARDLPDAVPETIVEPEEEVPEEEDVITEPVPSAEDIY